jgi:Flp pilus assembly protein TadG
MRIIASLRSALSQLMRRSVRRVPGEQGAVMVIVAGGMVVLLGMAGLVLDSGRAFLVKAELSRAVDAGVLAGARAIRAGQATARRQAIAVASANGVSVGEQGVTIDVGFGLTPEGEPTVTVTARRPLRTALMRLVGRDVVEIASTATAVVPPIDMVLVIDQSTSLLDMGAWPPLKEAAKELITYFDDDMDQVGLVSFGVRATDRYQMSGAFSFDIDRAIDNIDPIYWTNAAEGLRLARRQITGPAVRERAVRIVIFFTDGQPTAARTLVGGEDRVITARDRDRTGQTIGGYYDNPDAIPMDQVRSADGCRTGDDRYFCPEWTEAGPGPHGPIARSMARFKTLAEASRIRAEDVFIYTIALGNPNALNELMRPDLDLLARVANEHEISDPDQPRGRTYFAPSVSELRSVFRQVAQDLVVRLSH